MTVTPDLIEQYGTICESVSTEEFRHVLAPVFPGRADIISLYASREAFSSLLDWMRIDARWKRALVVLLHRMEEGRVVKSPPRTLGELSELLGRSVNSVGIHARASSPISYVMLLREAHYLTGGDPLCIAAGNPYRELGLLVRQWCPLASAGVRRLDQLVEYTPEGLCALPNIGAARAETISQALEEKGLSLKTE